MITTDVYILAELFANRTTTLADADLRSYIANPPDFDAVIAALAGAGAIIVTAPSGVLVYQIGPNETDATIIDRAMAAGVSPAEMWIVEEMVAMGMPGGSPFHDAVSAAGLNADDARSAGASAIALGVIRRRRIGNSDLADSNGRAKQLADIAAANV